MRVATALLFPAILLAAAGCGPRYVREEVFEHRNLVVSLRAQVAEGEEPAIDGRVDRGFDHPVTISSVRIANILSRIDVRVEKESGDDQRQPAFETVLLYTVGEKMALAFAKADSTQEVTVQAVRTEKRFGIFTAKYLTSFTAWVAGEDLYIALSRVDWEIPKEKGDDPMPEPWPDRRFQEFKVLPAEGIIPQAEQVVAADWRNPIFREATNVRVGAGGRLLRKTILLESPDPGGEEQEEVLSAMPLDLPADTLRELAELQEQRERGEISESLYLERRRDILRKAAEEPPPQPR